MSRLSEELRERTKQYASAVIRLYVELPKARDEVRVLGKQLLRSGTSVAAHAREASRARSDSEFCSKLDGLLQEADRPVSSKTRNQTLHGRLRARERQPRCQSAAVVCQEPALHRAPLAIRRIDE